MERYTHGHHTSVVAAHGSRTAADSAAYLLPHLRPGLSVLDVGCGPGSITLDLAAAVAPGAVVGIDPSEAVIETARATAAERADTTTQFTVGDAYAIDAADNTYDVVHAHQVLQHLTDPVRALREMARVTKPGGLIAARDADYAAFTWAPASPGLDRWLELYRELAHRNRAEPDAGRHLLRWAREAGLDDVTYTTSTWTFATAESRQWWANSWAARSTRSAFAEQARELGASDRDLTDLAQAWLDWATDPAAVLWIPHGELLARVP